MGNDNGEQALGGLWKSGQAVAAGGGMGKVVSHGGGRGWVIW